jgi:ribonuclease-3
MEFLGDSLVNLIVAEALHARWPKDDAGALTRPRASLVRQSALASIARDLQLGERIEFGPGEMKSGGHRRDSILADALEAVVAAIHLDAGFDACRALVLPWFEPMLAELPVGKVGKDAKTRLQEWLQARQRPRPEYTLIDSSGEEHARTFRVSCRTEDPAVSAEGEGNSLRIAEQAAAALVLAQIEVLK